MGCRRETCGFVGSYADYKTHKCPMEVNLITDVEKLYELINCDERLYIKMRVLEVFAERVIDIRTGDVDKDYLAIVYTCLEKFVSYIEIQNMCLDMISRVMETSCGISRIKDCCNGIEDCLMKCRSKPALEVKADRILEALKKDQAISGLVAIGKNKA